jgi:hypothetical protein
MPHQKINAAAHRNDARQENAMKFVAIAAAMAFLAGCAVTVPLRLTDTPGGDPTCTANFDRKCFDSSANERNADRHAPTVGGGN